MNEKKKEIKREDTSIAYELRKIVNLPLPILCRQLGISLETSRLIQTLIKDFLNR